jgi:hypothetical protein
MSRRDRTIKLLAQKYGRVVTFAGSSHYKLVDPTGQYRTVIAASSPRDVDTWAKNLENDLRRPVCKPR